MSDIIDRMRNCVPTNWFHNSKIILEAADEISILRQKLLESQAREDNLRHALEQIANNPAVNCEQWAGDLQCSNIASHAISMKYDDTALKDYKRQVLMDAIRVYSPDDTVTDYQDKIIELANEQKLDAGLIHKPVAYAYYQANELIFIDIYGDDCNGYDKKPLFT